MPERLKKCDLLGLGIMPFDLLFSVKEFPKPEIKLDGTGMHMQGGGPVPTVCVGLSRLGYATSFVSIVGDDIFGKLGREELCKEGVDESHVVVRKGKCSAIASGWIENGSGRRTLVLNRELFLKPADVKLNKLPVPKIIHLDGRDLDATIKLARWGKRVGATISFDIGSVRNDVSPVFKYVDHLVVADSYAFPFTGCRSSNNAIKKLRKQCQGTIVITEGLKGSTGFENGEFVTQQAYKVKTVDTTGAGDAFHVGYLYGLLIGSDLRRRLLLGSVTAAINCTRPGARTGLPSKRELNQFLRKLPARHRL